MKDNGELVGLEARRTPPLQLDGVKTPQLAKATAVAAPLAISKAGAAIEANPESTKAAKWNTKNLALRLAADAISAASAAVLVAPLISIIDR